MGPVRQHVDDAPDAALEVHVYPGRDGAFTLYEDEGDGYAYETGAFATTELTWDDATRCLTIGERVGRYRGMSAEREVIVTVHGAADAHAEASGPAIIRTVRHGGGSVVVPCSTAAEATPARPTGRTRILRGGLFRVAVRSRAPKTTIVDIARASGVSVTTVSRILNDKPDVAQETRDRVIRVMDDLGSLHRTRGGRSVPAARASSPCTSPRSSTRRRTV